MYQTHFIGVYRNKRWKFGKTITIQDYTWQLHTYNVGPVRIEFELERGH